VTESSFFHWWLTQLASLVPGPLRRGWYAGGKTVTLEIEHEHLAISPVPGGERILVDLPTGPAARIDRNDELAGRIPSALNTLKVRLAPQEFLVRRFTLPLAARTHLAEAVGYQLPKLIPFSSAQVLYACGVEKDSPASGPLNVWLAAVPRRRLEAALTLLDIDMPEGALPIASPPAQGDWLDFTWRIQQRTGLSFGSRRLLWAGAAACWLAGLGLHLHNKQSDHDALSSTLADLRGQSAEVSRLREQLTNTIAQVDWLNQKKQSVVSTLDILDILTRELEDDTWLQTLELKDNEVSIQGLSPAPAGLIEKLEDATLLRDVRFESAITQDARNQGSRFSISARLRPLTGGDGA
jgi:general secretion pathway protein L